LFRNTNLDEMEKKKILLVEDDRNLGIVIKDFLEMEGYSVRHCMDGRSGKIAFQEDKFHMIIIDIMLPLIDGFSLAEYIKNKDTSAPLIFLSAKSMQKDKIKRFKIGAGDYITKPFSTEELLLRINAVLRRINGNYRQEHGNERYTFGIFEFDYPEQLLKTDTSKIQLTNKEAEVLKMLCIYKNRL